MVTHFLLWRNFLIYVTLDDICSIPITPLVCTQSITPLVYIESMLFFKIFNKSLQYPSETKFVNHGFEFWRGLGLLIETYNGISKYWPQILRVRYQVGAIGSGSILHVFGI